MIPDPATDSQKESVEGASAAKEKISVVCAGCEQKLSVAARLAGKAVKCPKCKSAVKIPAAEPDEEPDIVILDDDDLVEEDIADGDFDSEADYGDDIGDFGEVLAGDYGEDLAHSFADDPGDGTGFLDADLPKKSSSRKKKSKKKDKQDKPKKRRQGPGFLSTALEVIVAFRVFIIGGLGIIGLIVALLASGVLTARNEELFVGEYGDSRTTSEWVAFLYAYEKDLYDGVNISMKRKDRYLRITKNIENCVGPDPEALPVLLRTLTDDSEANGRCLVLARTVLRKFVTTQTKPHLGDVEEGLASDHPEVQLWSVRLAAILGPEASGVTSRIEELSGSGGDDMASAAQETLATIGG